MGRYEVFADDDDVIGLTVAKTYPHGYAIVRTDPPIMDAFDEFEVATVIAKALTEHQAVERLFTSTAGVSTTVCSQCGGSGTQEV